MGAISITWVYYLNVSNQFLVVVLVDVLSYSLEDYLAFGLCSCYEFIFFYAFVYLVIIVELWHYHVAFYISWI